MEKERFDVDLVYLWVDGNDPVWRAKRDACIGRPSKQSSTNCEGRFVDNDELRHSLRSVEKYAPWIRRIFIVTDGQTPKWLDTTHPKIRIVDHTEILPPESLPCFNANILEHHIHRIPGLAEHFLFANDDTFFNRPVTPDTFYGADGLPIVRYLAKPFYGMRSWLIKHTNLIHMNNFSTIIHNAALLVEREFGTYYPYRVHHNIDSYLRSDYEHAREMFRKEIDATLTNHSRADNDIHRSLYHYVALAEHRAHPSFVDKHTSLRLDIHKTANYPRVAKYNPYFLCMNDSQHVTDEHRRLAARFLDSLFPEKSQFEK